MGSLAVGANFPDKHGNLQNGMQFFFHFVTSQKAISQKPLSWLSGPAESWSENLKFTEKSFNLAAAKKSQKKLTSTVETRSSPSGSWQLSQLITAQRHARRLSRGLGDVCASCPWRFSSTNCLLSRRNCWTSEPWEHENGDHWIGTNPQRTKVQMRYNRLLTSFSSSNDLMVQDIDSSVHTRTWGLTRKTGCFEVLDRKQAEQSGWVCFGLPSCTAATDPAFQTFRSVQTIQNHVERITGGCHLSQGLSENTVVRSLFPWRPQEIWLSITIRQPADIRHNKDSKTRVDE